MKGMRLARVLAARTNISTLVFFVTSRCNARCPFCFYRTNTHTAQEELSLKEIELISSKAPPIYEVLLSGGEPFLRDDIAEIACAFARNNKVMHLNIPTNGYLAEKALDTAVRVSAAIAPAELSMMVSLDNTGSRHDNIRGVPGLFERAAGLLRELKKLQEHQKNFRVGVVTTLNADNAGALKETIDFVRRDLDIQYVCLNYPRGNVADERSRNVSLAAYREAVEYLFSGPYRQFRRGLADRISRAIDRERYETAARQIAGKSPVYACRAALNTVVLSETGDVFPCELLDWKMGNVRQSDYSLAAILQAKAAECSAKIHARKCSCSWECMVHWNMLYDVKSYPRIIRNAITGR